MSKQLNILIVSFFALFATLYLQSCKTHGKIPGDLSHLVEPSKNERPDNNLKVMQWNIWHGGREAGETEGPGFVLDVIRQSGADIVAMQETYGSGEIISSGLGFHYLTRQPDENRNNNVSIHSRYPIIEDISVFHPFKCAGALIQLPDNSILAFYSIWLPYNEDIWVPGIRDTISTERMIAATQASADDLEKILKEIKLRLQDEKYNDIPVIIAGDFNAMSHLDYTSEARDQYRFIIDWPTCKILESEGFTDAYRECNPIVNRNLDRTWSPKFPEQEQDRIDFIFYRGNALKALNASVIQQHPINFPSDHAAIIATFRLNP